VDPLVEQSLRAIQRGSKSFALAAQLFDPPTREGAILLYAWCRHCDDQIDEQMLGFRTGAPSSGSAEERLAALERETRRALAGEPVEDPAFAALQEVARRHDIPQGHPLDLLKGFAMDVEGRRYETLEDCCRYCYHVAGVVGVMMAYVMGARGEDTLDRASDLGIAFQMTNIARDVVDDAGAGRVYLPGDWLREAGVPSGEVARPEHRHAVHAVTERLLDEAERYYASAQVGLARLPFRSAWAVAAARRVYRDIGRLVRQRGPRAWDHRASTGRARKVLLALAAAGDAAVATRRRSEETAVPRDGLWTRPRGQGSGVFSLPKM
jgi:phytoene synthase